MTARDQRIKRSRAQEKRVAKAMGAVQHGGSGAGPWRKNDLHTSRFLVEAKCRAKPDAKQITIKLTDLQDVAKNAAIAGLEPALTFELGGVDYLIIPNASVESDEETT